MTTTTHNKALSPQNQAGKKEDFQILNEHFQVQNINLQDLKVTGAQIAAAAGHNDANSVVILQQLPNGAMESIRPDELVDLRESGIERFFVIAGDSTFRFVLDGANMEWPRNEVNGRTLRLLANKTEAFEVLQQLEGHPAHVIDEDESADLSANGVEYFKTRHADKKITVYYGEIPYKLARGTYTTEQLINIFSVDAGYVLDLITHDGRFVELKPGAQLRIKEGMHFASHPPCGQSS
jgi:hypothetical protein